MADEVPWNNQAFLWLTKINRRPPKPPIITKDDQRKTNLRRDLEDRRVLNEMIKEVWDD